MEFECFMCHLLQLAAEEAEVTKKISKRCFKSTLLTKHVHNYIEYKGNALYSTTYFSKYCQFYPSC